MTSNACRFSSDSFSKCDRRIFRLRLKYFLFSECSCFWILLRTFSNAHVTYRTTWKRSITIVALTCFSLPTFFFASLLKLVFAVKLKWFDLGGLIGRSYQQLSPAGQFWDKAAHLVLPIITLVVISIGSLMRYTRTNMLEVLNADYIRTARAKGLSERKVIYHHAFRNTLIPIVTIVGGSLPGLFSGALITETLFSLPGIGYVSYQSMVSGDIPFSMFYLVFLAILTLLGNLISDILYAVVDPRVRIA